MKALYNCSFADPWVEVAKILKDKYNIQPVYWIGHDDDNSRELVPSVFPEAIYHEYFDAWKGVFPQQIKEFASACSVDIDFYQKILKYETQGLNLMDRMDADQQSFNYQERRYLFRKFLRYWSAIIDYYQIKLLISPVMPHRSFDYPLYLVCRHKGVKIVGFISTPFSSAGRILRVDNICSISSKVEKDYKKILNDQVNLELADDIQSRMEGVLRSYEDAIPPGLKESNRFFKKKASVVQTGMKFFYELATKKSIWLGKDGWLMKGVPSYNKGRKTEVEQSKTRLYLVPYIVRIYKRIRFLKKLKKEYIKITQQPDLNKPYAIFALHYQPEATSAPRAGLFSDQLYVLELLSKYLPDDWNIYVKENPKQFNPIAEGNTGRLKRFYKDALKSPRVFFIPVESNPFILIDQARVVITIAGTMGFEGMVRGKPVICFGPSWYDAFTGAVLRIKENGDLEGMVDFINNYKYDEIRLLSYLKAVEQNTIRAYFRRGLREVMDVGLSQSVNELVKSISEYLGSSNIMN